MVLCLWPESPLGMRMAGVRLDTACTIDVLYRDLPCRSAMLLSCVALLPIAALLLPPLPLWREGDAGRKLCSIHTTWLWVLPW
jgi:hypothetical protein